MKQHPTSVVSPKAEIADDVEIGPFCIIEDDVFIGTGCKLDSHVVVHNNVTIGMNNRFHQSCAIGDLPQDVSHNQKLDSRVVIGNGNTFREFFTVHKGTSKDNLLTTIGNDGFFMASSHVAHDCIIGDNVVFVNTASAGGHSIVGNNAYIGPFSGIHQFCRVGDHAFVSGPVIVNQDIVPFSMVVPGKFGRSTIHGFNLVGLRRQDFNKETIKIIKQAFRFLFKSGLNTNQAVEKIKRELNIIPEIKLILDFINDSKRGISK